MTSTHQTIKRCLTHERDSKKTGSFFYRKGLFMKGVENEDYENLLEDREDRFTRRSDKTKAATRSFLKEFERLRFA